MAEYIEREAARTLIKNFGKDAIRDGKRALDPVDDIILLASGVDLIPAVDVIPKVAYEQVLWERDLALHQLKEHYGVGLGEKKADVAPVVHGRWEFLGPNSLNQEVWCGTCSACHVRSKYIVNKEICPNCGAKMDGEEQDDECRRLEER